MVQFASASAGLLPLLLALVGLAVGTKDKVVVTSKDKVNVTSKNQTRAVLPGDSRDRFGPDSKGPIFHPIDGGHIIPKVGSPRAIKGGDPGAFSLYVFALNWKAEWCMKSRHPGCHSPRDYWKQNLTIHGLWPDYGDSSYPTMCTDEAYDHDAVVGAFTLETLENVWPNVEVPEGDQDQNYDSFWEHEWVKHGTCTGLTQEAYFRSSLSIATERFPTPELLPSSVGGTISRHAIDQAYGGKGRAVLQCRLHSGQRFLSQIFLCFDKNTDTGEPGEQITCPSPVMLHDDSCGRAEINMASF